MPGNRTALSDAAKSGPLQSGQFPGNNLPKPSTNHRCPKFPRSDLLRNGPQIPFSHLHELRFACEGFHGSLDHALYSDALAMQESQIPGQVAWKCRPPAPNDGAVERGPPVSHSMVFRSGWPLDELCNLAGFSKTIRSKPKLIWFDLRRNFPVWHFVDMLCSSPPCET
jgi:hypothetical protein